MEYVKKHLYDDVKLSTEAAKLKNNFMNNAQALIHRRFTFRFNIYK